MGMDLRFGGFLPGVPRHVETADAKLEIRRDESRGEGRRKDREEDAASEAASWDDVATVSTAALRAFLENLIHVPVAVTVDAPLPAEATPSARAASAYQAVGRAVHDGNVMPDPAPADSSAAAVRGEFTEAEFARIRAYLAAIGDLERRGVTQLSMQRSATFLDSLGDALAALAVAAI